MGGGGERGEEVVEWRGVLADGRPAGRPTSPGGPAETGPTAHILTASACCFTGCPYPQKKRFLTELLDQMTTEMMEYVKNSTDKRYVVTVVHNTVRPR